MARLARVIVPGLPHHVTQRGNRRETTFFQDSDYALYLDLLAEAAVNSGSEVLAYCLMPNHAHVILTPSDGVRRTFANLHRRYTGHVNARNRWPPRRSETTGRPLGSDGWIAKLERQTGRSLAPRKRGPKPRPELSKLSP